MKKIYKMQNLDCANCAAKMETAISKIDGVESCSISFMSQKMTLEVDETKLDAVLTAAQNAVIELDKTQRAVLYGEKLSKMVREAQVVRVQVAVQRFQPRRYYCQRWRMK